MPESPSSDTPPRRANYFRDRAIFVIIIVLLAFAWKLNQDVRERYRANATLHVDQTIVTGHGTQTVPQGASAHWQTKLNTMVELIPNSRLMEQVIMDHDLMNDVEFAGPNAGEADLSRMAHMASSRTQARLRPETELIDITFIHHSPQLARKLANWIAQGFIKQQSNRRATDNRFASKVLNDEAERLKLKLRNAEVALIDFRKSSNLVISLEERHGMLSSLIIDQNEILHTLMSEISIIEDDLKLIDSYGKDASVAQLLTVPSIANAEEVQTLKHEIENAESQLHTNQFGPQHPQTQRQKDAVKALISRLNRAIEETPRRLEATLSQLRVKAKSATTMVKQTEEESLDLAAKAVEYNVLQREVTATQSLLETVLNRIKEIDHRPAPQSPVIRVVEEASSASNITPDRTSDAIETAVIALVLSITGIFIFDKVRAEIPKPKPGS